jgi:hypothetical protein
MKPLRPNQRRRRAASRRPIRIPGGRVIDLHAHLFPGREDEDAREMLEEADLLGFVEYLGLSYIPMGHDPARDAVRAGNDRIASWVKQSQGRFRGLAYLNPRHRQGALDELQRCYNQHGMRMVKLLTSVRCSDPLVFPIVEECIDLRLPILQHAFSNAVGNEPNESRPEDVAELARRYPKARLVMAHIAGDYIHGAWTIRALPNVWTDISGTYCEAGMVETAVRELGAARVVFGSDNGIAFNLGKVQDARIPESAKARILYHNAKGLLP